jgi:hypothetical protein
MAFFGVTEYSMWCLCASSFATFDGYRGLVPNTLPAGLLITREALSMSFYFSSLILIMFLTLSGDLEFFSIFFISS